LVVVYGFMNSHKDMTEPVQNINYQAFFQWGKCETFKGGNFVVYSWWMQRNGARK